MRKTASLLILLVLVMLMLCSCARSLADHVDTGSSSLFTDEERAAAASVTENAFTQGEFSKYCTLTSITYAGDERCEAESASSGSECIVFNCDFTTKAFEEGSDTAFIPNQSYSDYSFILTRDIFGWHIMSYGYA